MVTTVSYTHLDVYKRQIPPCGNCQPSRCTRRAQNTRPSSCISTMPTLGRKPSGSITIGLRQIHCVRLCHVACAWGKRTVCGLTASADA